MGEHAHAEAKRPADPVQAAGSSDRPARARAGRPGRRLRPSQVPLPATDAPATAATLRVPPSPGRVPDPTADPGQPLDGAIREFMEPRIGRELSGVRVHTDGRAAASARALGALAYTVGSDVVFAAGRYDPYSPSGARLLGHELTHVTQGPGRPFAPRRSPDPARLDVIVPDPAAVPAFEPGVDYAWQNPLIRQTVFPLRESAFRQFLLEEKKIDLGAEFAGAKFSAAMAADIGTEILAERQRLTDERAEHGRLRKQAEADLPTARAATKEHLADPAVREQERTRRDLEVRRRALAGKLAAQQGRITQLEKLGAGMTTPQQRELDQRREMLAEIDAELTPVAASLAEVGEALKAGTEPFTGAEAALSAQIAEHRKREVVLGQELKDVSGGVDLKTGRARPDAAVRWRLRQFSQQISGMGHDELLGLVLDQFAADKDFSRYKKQERYLIIHFSGMRYASASRTWGPPQELLATLKEQEIREMFAVADRTAVEQEAEQTGAEIEAELGSKDTGGARTAQLKAARAGLDAPAAARARLAATRPKEAAALADLESNVTLREKALADGDADSVERANQQIELLEKQIGAPELKRVRVQLAAADRKRLETLRDFRIREARQAMNGLSDLDALSVLQSMKDAFPPWVWHEVVRRTQLRVKVTDPQWDEPVPVKSLDRRDPVTARWLAILDHWPREETVSVEKQGEKFEIVATAVVCNQLSEQAQHTFGKKITQGIRGAVEWYRDKAAKAAGRGDQPFFIRPAKEQDFVEGAGLFWAHFETAKKPAEGNMARPLGGIDFLTEARHAMQDGLVEGEWTYHIDPVTHDITRTKGRGDTLQTQWFSWQHEATVLKRAPGRVITFETSAGARRHSWTLSSLLDPMNEPWIKSQHGDTNVFVGYAPGADTMPQLDPALENILPGRGAL